MMIDQTKTDLEDVGNGLLAVNLLLHDAILVDTYGGEDVQNILVHVVEAVDDEGDSDLLPAGVALLGATTPVLGLLGLADVTDVKHDTVEGASVEGLVLVVRGDGNQELSLAVVHPGAEVPAVLSGEVIRVAGGSGVAHVAE
jgi:hypothetical protein